MAKEFGSRAEMISLKIDEVSRNKIWREHCTKVQKQHTLNTTFCIGDPRKMTGAISDKPNYIWPQLKLDEAEVAEAAQTLKELCSFKSTELGPHDKYESPLAMSHEVGWHSKVQLVRSHPMFSAARGSCDVTQFADNYWNLTGTTPFSKKVDG